MPVAPLPGLPDPGPVIERLRGGQFARGVEEIGARILEHRFPLLGGEIETGPEIDWRRDYVHGIASGTRYFRLVPYLDFSYAGDHKFIWELSRHQHLVLLAQAFRFTGRDEFRREIVRQLESWLEANPFCRGINWTSALEVGFRAISWIWVHHLIGGDFDARFRRRFAQELYGHGCYLERNLSIYFSPNTHLLGEAVALHALGKLFPEFPGSKRWERIGGDLVTAQMQSQVRADGSHFEQSTYYQLYALDMFLFHAAIARTDAAYQEKLSAMAVFLGAVSGPGCRLPLIGDDDGGRFFHPYGERERFGNATLATCGLADRTEDLDEQAIWWLGAGRPAFRNAPAPQSRLFPDAGLAVMRHGDLQLIADAGPFGVGSAGHSHSDTLSIVLRNGNQDLLVDSGTFTYIGDTRLRNWFRGSAAHNTIRVDERDQARAAGAFRWQDQPVVEILEWRTSAEEDCLEARCRHGETGIVHRRRILFLKGALPLIFILDVVEGAAGTHLVEQFWHLGHRGAAAILKIGGGDQAALSEGGEHGWRSRCFSRRSPAPVIRMARTTALPCRFWTVIDISGEDHKLTAGDTACSYRGAIFSGI